MGLAPLKVSVADKQLQVILTPRRDLPRLRDDEPRSPTRYSVGPRETMTWDLQTLDAAGKPISAEVSLALVDKAVLTLADDDAGTTDGSLLPRARRWACRPARRWCSTSIGWWRSWPRAARAAAVAAAMAPNWRVRREFPDTAYWNATVTTGADGKAQVELTLPDNLTTWTMDAAGHHRRDAGGPEQGGHDRHQGPAGAAGAAALLRRRRPGRDRRRGPQQHERRRWRLRSRCKATGLQIAAPHDAQHGHDPGRRHVQSGLARDGRRPARARSRC